LLPPLQGLWRKYVCVTRGRLEKLGWIMLKIGLTHFHMKVAFLATTKGKDRRKAFYVHAKK
jgi:hypothetical protein